MINEYLLSSSFSYTREYISDAADLLNKTDDMFGDSENFVDVHCKTGKNLLIILQVMHRNKRFVQQQYRQNEGRNGCDREAKVGEDLVMLTEGEHTSYNV